MARMPRDATPYRTLIAGVSLAWLAILSAAASGAPRLSVQPERFDFGTRGSHETVEKEFLLTNRGEGELVLGRTGAGCACTADDLKGTRLVPGESIPLNVRLPLAGRRGSQRITVAVESNDPRRGRVDVVMSGRISGAIDIRPAQIFMGPIERAGQPVRTLRIRWPRRAPHAITHVESLSPWFSAVLDPASGGREWRIDVAPRETPPWGEVRGIIRFQTSHPDFALVEIPVRAQHIPGPLIWIPRELAVPPDAPHAAFSETIIVRTTQAETFRITDIDVPAPLKAREQALPGGRGYRIAIEGPGAGAELDGRVVRIMTDVAEYPMIEIPIRTTHSDEAPDA